MTTRMQRIQVWVNALTHLPKNFTGLEFGVCTGNSINFFAKFRPSAKFHGFDSFKGLPEVWSRPNGQIIPIGYFKLPNYSKYPMSKNITLHVGKFEETLIPFWENLPAEEKKSINLIHFDADVYSSTVYILEQLKDFIIKEKPYLLFDELFCTKNKQILLDEEGVAFLEFVNKYNLNFSILYSGTDRAFVKLL